MSDGSMPGCSAWDNRSPNKDDDNKTHLKKICSDSPELCKYSSKISSDANRDCKPEKRPYEKKPDSPKSLNEAKIPKLETPLVYNYYPPLGSPDIPKLEQYSSKKEEETDSSDENDTKDAIMNMGLACVICKQSDVNVGHQLMECKECHSLYHQECHRPPASDYDPREEWYCAKCEKSMKMVLKTAFVDYVPAASSLPPDNIFDDSSSSSFGMNSPPPLDEEEPPHEQEPDSPPPLHEESDSYKVNPSVEFEVEDLDSDSSDTAEEKNTRLIVYPSSAGGISVYEKDLKCLDNDNLLNDTIIEFYIDYLEHNLNEELRRKIHIYSTFFYSQLKNKIHKMEMLDKWTKKVDIFSKNYLLIPVHVYEHWMLSIISSPGLVLDTISTVQENEGASTSKESKAAADPNVQKPCILILDSLTNQNTYTEIFTLLKMYLEREWLSKKHSNKSFQSLKCIVMKCAKQRNSTDCGLFLLQHAESFFESIKKNDINYYDQPDVTSWCPVAKIAGKRKEIRNLIFYLKENNKH